MTLSQPVSIKSDLSLLKAAQISSTLRSAPCRLVAGEHFPPGSFKIFFVFFIFPDWTVELDAAVIGSRASLFVTAASISRIHFQLINSLLKAAVTACVFEKR